MSPSGSQISPAWYAVYAQVRHESKVYSRLLGKSFECLFPQMERWSRRRDRRKKIQVPIFPGYLFVRAILDNHQQVRILDRKSTRLNSSHSQQSRMPSSA